MKIFRSRGWFLISALLAATGGVAFTPGAVAAARTASYGVGPITEIFAAPVSVQLP
jgi:hypothetical protein